MDEDKDDENDGVRRGLSTRNDQRRLLKVRISSQSVQLRNYFLMKKNISVALPRETWGLYCKTLRITAKEEV